MTTPQPESPTTTHSCYQCEGKGFTEIRDCAGEVQRTETCSYCEGRGIILGLDQLDCQKTASD